jgi:hypothetical protein
MKSFTNRIIHLFFFTALLALFWSCKNTEKAKRSDLEGKKADYLIAQMKQNEFNFETFSAKAVITLRQDGKKLNFKSNIRIRRDSAIWISITPLFGIEMGRVLITKDTVKVINRLEKQFFVGDYEYLNQKFNVDLEYEVLQAILLGNSIAFELDEKIKFSVDKEDYYLGNLRKSKAKKADEKPRKIEKQKEEVVSLWINQESFKIDKFLLSDLTADRFILGEYKNQMTIEDQQIPEYLHFEVQSALPAIVEIQYSRVSLNQALKFSFNISSKYEQILF